MESITTGMTTLTTVVTKVFDMITGNELLAVFAAAGLVGVGIGVFSAIKAAAR